MSVQLHCGSCDEDCAGCTNQARDTCSECASVHLQSCSGTDRAGNTVALRHCSPENRNDGHHSVRLQSCSGVDQNGTSVTLDHCFGEPVSEEHAR